MLDVLTSPNHRGPLLSFVPAHPAQSSAGEKSNASCPLRPDSVLCYSTLAALLPLSHHVALHILLATPAPELHTPSFLHAA